MVCGANGNRSNLVHFFGKLSAEIMVTCAPIGWSGYANLLHYKTVAPCKSEVGMYNTIYKNVSRKFLPKDVYDNSQRKLAKKVLKNQKRMHETQRPKPDLRLRRYVQNPSNDPTYAARSDNVFHERPFFPPIRKNLPITSYLPYSPKEVSTIVKRLSTYDKYRVPESRGYPIPTPEPSWTKEMKKYNEDDIQEVVNRLSHYDPEFHPPESRGSVRTHLQSRGTTAATQAPSRGKSSKEKSEVDGKPLNTAVQN
ncbi:uncharacterized protein LOC125652385 isoform X1 [Ostrea edulis]|uniref:uncharacterized protein LOC125652385 isoform X1 n=2 Tax=Ostrea edulis TaxID=37623 RepID=UPI0024AEFD2B|nr:uncharacterized protein LOC125652385 isoform X1 [Ostrea edulis]